jgi:hypothetical protein
MGQYQSQTPEKEPFCDRLSLRLLACKDAARGSWEGRVETQHLRRRHHRLRSLHQHARVEQLLLLVLLLDGGEDERAEAVVEVSV